MDTTSAHIAYEVPIFYATTEGQTRRIAEYLAAVFRDQGFTSHALVVTSADAQLFDWTRARAAIVGASLHIGSHQAEAASFVQAHAAELNARPSAFFSVSLSAASSHAEETDAARRLAEAFPPAHGWTAPIVSSIAGRLAYTKYGPLKRLLLKWIAKKEGAPTDTSRDYELTNWNDADKLVSEVIALIRGANGGEGSRTAA
jgi:menaquinone-dependent protoporphyrinogen oxidase